MLKQLIYRVNHWKKHGLGTWVVTLKEENNFIGYGGVQYLHQEPESLERGSPRWNRCRGDSGRFSSWISVAERGIRFLVLTCGQIEAILSLCYAKREASEMDPPTGL